MPPVIAALYVIYFAYYLVLLESSHIDEVIVTNTVPHDHQKLRCHKIKTVDISLLLCEAIRRIYHNESMGPLFRDLTIDD